MKLVLASQGFTNPEIAQATARLAGKSFADKAIDSVDDNGLAIFTRKIF